MGRFLDSGISASPPRKRFIQNHHDGMRLELKDEFWEAFDLGFTFWVFPLEVCSIELMRFEKGGQVKDASPTGGKVSCHLRKTFGFLPTTHAKMKLHRLGFGQGSQLFEGCRIRIGRINRTLSFWLDGKKDQVGKRTIGQVIRDLLSVMR